MTFSVMTDTFPLRQLTLSRRSFRMEINAMLYLLMTSWNVSIYTIQYISRLNTALGTWQGSIYYFQSTRCTNKFILLKQEVWVRCHSLEYPLVSRQKFIWTNLTFITPLRGGPLEHRVMVIEFSWTSLLRVSRHSHQTISNKRQETLWDELKAIN